jgi:glycerol-3-phosphate dehydrogenase (NAD(P)+)
MPTSSIERKHVSCSDDGKEVTVSVKKYRVGIIGGGAWGTAIGRIIGKKGHDVRIWCLEKEIARDINDKHVNTRFLPEGKLPETISATNDIIEAASGRDFLIIATPSAYIVDTVKRILQVPEIVEGTTLIGIITKGFVRTNRGVRLIVETLENYLPGSYKGNLVFISGPSMATEVAMGKVTGLISASQNGLNSIKFRQLLNSETLVVFSSFDIIGVQVSAASKNIIAIAFGMLEAFIENSEEFGMNTESLLLAAGLNEIQLLGHALGSTHPETFTSIAGVGDLDVTCRSIYGRNRRFGREIITRGVLSPYGNIGELIEHIPDIGYLPEGVLAADCVHDLLDEIKMKESRLRLPIAESVYTVLNREIEPYDALRRILTTITRGTKSTGEKDIDVDQETPLT